MRLRDRLVLVVLVAGALAAVAAWDALGRWWALGLALAAVIVAGLVYRIGPAPEPTRREDLRGRSGARRDQ